MNRLMKAFSVLLIYPDQEYQDAVPAIREIVDAHPQVPNDLRGELDALLDDLATTDIFDLQERYVLLFDRSRTLSLNLFEHIHGESRDRGGAMVDLLETYRAHGYDLDTVELPDHLPVFLEFLSRLPAAEAQGLLAEAGHIIAALGERLRRRESGYAAVFEALTRIAEIETASDLVRSLTDQEDDDPEDLKALDAVWEEAEVTFGPDPNAGCPVAREALAKMTPAPAERGQAGGGNNA